MRPVFRALAKDFRRIVTRQFDTEGAYLSGGWAPLSDSRVEQKQYQGLDGPILVATGALRKSFTQGRSGYREMGMGSFMIGSTDPTAGMHQSGTATMPARPLFIMTPAISRRWTRAMGNYIVQGRVSLIGIPG